MTQTKNAYIESVLSGCGAVLYRVNLDDDSSRRDLVAVAGTIGNVLAEIGLPTGTLSEAIEAVRNASLAAMAHETRTEARTEAKGEDRDEGLKIRNPVPAPRIPPRGGMVAPDLSSLPSL